MSLALLSDEISIVYAPLAVSGTLNVAEPVLAMPAVENMSVLFSSGRKQRVEVHTSHHSPFVQIVGRTIAQCQSHRAGCRRSPCKCS